MCDSKKAFPPQLDWGFFLGQLDWGFFLGQLD
jgi:hypothetical protein